MWKAGLKTADPSAPDAIGRVLELGPQTEFRPGWTVADRVILEAKVSGSHEFGDSN